MAFHEVVSNGSKPTWKHREIFTLACNQSSMVFILEGKTYTIMRYFHTFITVLKIMFDENTFSPNCQQAQDSYFTSS